MSAQTHRVGWQMRWRSLWTPLAIAALFAAMILVALLTTPPPDPIPYDLDSSHPGGLLGLRLWLEQLGYDVRRTGGLRFDLPEGSDLLFVYPNQLTYTAEEAARIRRWVEGGGTLVLVGPTDEDRHLIDAFGVRLDPELHTERRQAQWQPLIPEGRASYTREWFASSAVLDLRDAPQAVPVLVLTDGADEDEPLAEIAQSCAVVAVQTVGQGVVWHLAPGVNLTNGNLGDFGQGDLLPAILRNVPNGGAPERGVIVFDAYHLFGLSRVGDQIATLQDWLYRTPTGWATLFALTLSALFLLLQGRRLGPPLVTVEQTRGREAAEYVRAMANLHRRAGRYSDLAQHHHRRLKVGIAKRRGIDADLSDDDFLDALAYASPPLPEPQIAAIRSTLSELADRPNEQQLVNLAASVDNLLHTMP